MRSLGNPASAGNVGRADFQRPWIPALVVVLEAMDAGFRAPKERLSAWSRLVVAPRRPGYPEARRLSLMIETSAMTALMIAWMAAVLASAPRVWASPSTRRTKYRTRQA